MLCGCGQEAKYQFKNGKWCCSKDWESCEGNKRYGEKHSMFGKHQSKETSQKRWETRRKNGKDKVSKETRKQMSNSHKNIIHDEEWNKNVSIALKGKSGKNKGKKLRPKTDEEKSHQSKVMKGKSHPCSEETKKKLSKVFRGRIVSEKTKEKQSLSHKKRLEKPEELRKSLEYLSLTRKSEHIKPTKPELEIKSILDNHNYEYEYTGDLRIWINGKNPDFLNEKSKKIIEFFGYRHTQKHRKKYLNDTLTNGEHEENRINHFEKEGYKCLVLWDQDLSNKERLLEKLSNFEEL